MSQSPIHLRWRKPLQKFSQGQEKVEQLIIILMVFVICVQCWIICSNGFINFNSKNSLLVNPLYFSSYDDHYFN